MHSTSIYYSAGGAGSGHYNPGSVDTQAGGGAGSKYDSGWKHGYGAIPGTGSGSGDTDVTNAVGQVLGVGGSGIVLVRYEVDY